VTRVRLLLRHHPRFAAAIVAAALLLRLLVPAGFMPSFNGGQFRVSICTGMGPAQMRIALPGKHSDVAASPCAFADLSLPLLGAADPVQLAAALAFIIATALALVVAMPTRRVAHLRPPLRGPPAA